MNSMTQLSCCSQRGNKSRQCVSFLSFCNHLHLTFYLFFNMSTIEPTTGTGAQALNMPMNEKSATTEPFGDQKFDPSVGSQTLSHPNGTAPTSELQSAPTSGLQSAPAANTSELAPATAPVEHAAEVPSTTTTTIM
jgi:hypothetical protein